MNLTREIHERILKDLIRPPGKLGARGVTLPYGMLVRAPACRLFMLVQ